MREPTAKAEGSVHVWKRMSDFRDLRTNAPQEHTSFRIEQGTKLSEVVAAASAAGIDSDSIAAFATTTLTKARHRSGDPFLGRTDPDAIILHRALGTAIQKALNGDGEELNEREELSVAIIAGGLQLGESEMYVKARHGVRHPTTGRFIPIPKPTPGPDPDAYGGARTEPVEPGTGSPASTPPNPAFPLWNHLGASLLG